MDTIKETRQALAVALEALEAESTLDMSSSSSGSRNNSRHAMINGTRQPLTLLTVSPGKLGLTIKMSKQCVGALITAIDYSSCTFANKVEIGDRLVTVDGTPITQISDLNVNNTKERLFGIVKKAVTTDLASASTLGQQSTTMTANTAAITPKGRGGNSSVMGNPIVTTEKASSAKNNNDRGDNHIKVIIKCPDGSDIQLSSEGEGIPSNVILGCNKYGIPSSSVSMVSSDACVLRIIETYRDNNSGNGKNFALELVPLGTTERCTVIRDGNPLFVSSIHQILSDDKRGLGVTSSLSSIILRSGDIIEPYDREKRVTGSHYEFKVDIVSCGDRSPPTKAAGKSEDTDVVMDGSAFAVASKKIDEAAMIVPVNGNGDFDKETLRRAFLSCPHSAANFFRHYFRILSKKTTKTEADKVAGSNLLNKFIDAMSPQDIASTNDAGQKLGQKLDHFPLNKILSLLLDGGHKDLAKRAIEGYIWLSCQKVPNGSIGFLPPSGPILLASNDLPLVDICNKIGWADVEDVLVHALEMLCKYQTTISNVFSLVEKIRPANDSDVTTNFLRVFFRMAEVAYEKSFIVDPEVTAKHFIRFHDSIIVSNSSEITVKLINAFVDAMSPLDQTKRRVPMMEVDNYFPLSSILRILVARKHMALAKRVMEGYVWLSCQKVSNGHNSNREPQGPTILAGHWNFSLIEFCDKIGWALLEDVLVDAVQKLYECKNTSKAYKLLEVITSKSSRCDDGSECSLVCARMAKVASSKMLGGFYREPSGTTKFFIAQYKNLKKDPKNNELRSKLLNSFVDIISDTNSRKLPVSPPDYSEFPLNDALTLLVDDKHMQLGKRVLEGYVWLSCQKPSWTEASGPRKLCTAAVPLTSMCDALGWKEFENVLVDAIEMLCKHRNTELAVLFVDKFVPASSSDLEQIRICSKMVKIACTKMIEELQRTHQFNDPYRLGFYKKLFFLIGNYCDAAVANNFVTLAKQLDVDLMLYPFLTDAVVRSSSSAGLMKNTLSKLTDYCAEKLSSRVAVDPNVVTAWTITNAHLYRHTKFYKFLENQCKETFDWKIRKSDHKLFQSQLMTLIRAGEIKCESHQHYGSGPYYFKITKLKTCRVSKSSLSCSCGTRIIYVGTQTPHTCLRESSQSKHRDDKAKLDVIKTFLTPEQLASHKRKAGDAFDDDDDDVVLTGVSGVEESVAKRVKAAEDAGEVIEIL